MKIRCALIGPGNIGTDLLYKLLRSDVLEPVWMVGIDPESDGLARARDMGLKTTHEGIDGLIPHIEKDNIKIAFDATSAYAHAETSRKLIEKGVKVIDLTPAAIGPFCVPPVNLLEHLNKGEDNVNMVTCGGQATIPMVFGSSHFPHHRISLRTIKTPQVLGIAIFYRVDSFRQQQYLARVFPLDFLFGCFYCQTQDTFVFEGL